MERRPLGMWAWLTPRNMLLPHLCYRVKFGYFMSYHSIVIMEICQKMLIAHTPLLKVTQEKVVETDTDRSTTYDFLLVFHSNYGPISYRFRDRGQYLLKKFHPFVFNAPAEGVPLEFCNGGGSREN